MQAPIETEPTDPEQPKKKVGVSSGNTRRMTVRERAKVTHSKEAVYVECFRFLKAFTRSYLEVQRRSVSSYCTV